MYLFLFAIKSIKKKKNVDDGSRRTHRGMGHTVDIDNNEMVAMENDTVGKGRRCNQEL